MHQSGWIVLAAVGVAAIAACGGSQPSAPSAPPTPDTSVSAGTTLSVASGETGQPIAGAHVVVSGRPYDTNSAGQVTLAERVPYGTLVDVTAPDFLDRQTLLRKNGARQFVLWPRSTPWGLNESYTAELIYTYGSADPPPVGSSPLERIRPGTKEAVVVVTDEIRQNDRVNEAHQIAVGHLNVALAGKITYVLSPTKPTTGVIFEARLDPADPVCADRVLAYSLMSYQSGEIVGGQVVYCRLDQADAALVTHELGHTTGLNHSPDTSDVMYAFLRHVEFFSRAETLSLGMLFERPAGNRFQDNDRTVAASGSSTRTTVCY
jgi:hypothetical protein